jgi:hypothetical protein
MIPPITPNEWEPDITPAREAPGNSRKMRIEHSRDHKVVLQWSPENITEVAYAYAAFNQFLNQRYHAFRVYENGAYARRILEFDPQAKDILLTAKIGWPPPEGYVPIWDVPGTYAQPTEPSTLTEADLKYLVPTERKL